MKNIKEKAEELEAELSAILRGGKQKGTSLSFESDILPEFEEALESKDMEPNKSMISQLLTTARTKGVGEVRFMSNIRAFEKPLEEFGKEIGLDLDDTREFVVSYSRLYRAYEPKEAEEEIQYS